MGRNIRSQIFNLNMYINTLGYDTVATCLLKNNLFVRYSYDNVAQQYRS